MNRIQRIAAAAAIGAAVLAPATVAPAFAEPYPWHESDGSSSVAKTKAQIEYEERLRMQPPVVNEPPVSETTTIDTGFPWETVGLAALGAGALAAGAAIVVRRNNRVPRPA